MLNKKGLCIYHHDCLDGFASAWVVHKYYGDKYEYVRAQYNTKLPDVEGRDVLMVDFSCPPEVLMDMLGKAKSITIIDHHEDAVRKLHEFEGLITLFSDFNHSGAVLTWKYFYRDIPVPKLLQHVEDHDLWRYELPFTTELKFAMLSYEFNFDNWDQLMRSDIQQLIRRGKLLSDNFNKNLYYLIGESKRRIRVGGYEVWAVNLPHMYASDACYILSNDEPFAVCYYDLNGFRKVSLRSRESGIDVSQIARMYGGNGRRHTAGFIVPFNQVQQFEIEIPHVEVAQETVLQS